MCWDLIITLYWSNNRIWYYPLTKWGSTTMSVCLYSGCVLLTHWPPISTWSPDQSPLFKLEQSEDYPSTPQKLVTVLFSSIWTMRGSNVVFKCLILWLHQGSHKGSPLPFQWQWKIDHHRDNSRVFFMFILSCLFIMHSCAAGGDQDGKKKMSFAKILSLLRLK